MKAKKSAKKWLGQNFLKSEIALRKIVEAGEIKSDDIILEIGPGRGALTEKLLEKAGTVIAVEKDYELFEFLKIKFSNQIKANTLILVCEDILDFEIESPHYKVIANIPYNITGAILKKFLGGSDQPESMILMVQHEVARRIMAADGKESVLSISVKAYGEPKLVMKVGARYFSPAPKVDSAVIAIKNISRKLFIENLKTVQSRTLHSSLHSLSVEEFEDRFWQIVKAGFAHKRKKLSGNLKNVIFGEKNGQGPSLGAFSDKRAEDLSLLDWILLTKKDIIDS